MCGAKHTAPRSPHTPPQPPPRQPFHPAGVPGSGAHGESRPSQATQVPNREGQAACSGLAVPPPVGGSERHQHKQPGAHPSPPAQEPTRATQTEKRGQEGRPAPTSLRRGCVPRTLHWGQLGARWPWGCQRKSPPGTDTWVRGCWLKDAWPVSPGAPGHSHSHSHLVVPDLRLGAPTPTPPPGRKPLQYGELGQSTWEGGHVGGPWGRGTRWPPAGASSLCAPGAGDRGQERGEKSDAGPADHTLTRQQ